MSKKSTALLLLLNTALAIALYFILIYLGIWFMPPIYLAVGAVFALVFIIYNRGFYAKNAKPEELPNTMTKEEKLAYIQDGKDRLNRSRWMLTVILPIVLTLACDLIYLYIFPYVKEIFL